MPAGTIALTNNSATVTGSGTSFTTELKVNDFVVSTVGGVAYTLGVKSIESNTSLTLMENYTGPSASGQSWTPVPYGTMAAITAQLAAQVTYAIRGLNLDKANWQQVFTAPGNITVSLPDGTSWQGPSWGYMANQFANKANTTDVLTKADNLASVTDKAAARSNLGVGYGNAAGTVVQGNDTRLGTVNSKTGGNITSGVIVDGGVNLRKTVSSEVSQSSEMVYSTIVTGTTERARIGIDIGTSAAGERVGRLYVGQDGTNKIFTFVYSSGNATAPGQWVNNSDRRLKTNVTTIDDPLGKMRKFHGCTWDRLDFEAKGIGFIAQDVQEVFPDSVYTGYAPISLMDGAKVDEPLSLDTSGVASALHHEAILALMDKFAVLEKSDSEKDAIISELQKRMKAIDGLDA